MGKAVGTMDADGQMGCLLNDTPLLVHCSTNRLHAGLDKEKEETEDAELKEYLTQQCAMMGSAKICTIHSFCLDVIKENYFVIGLSPNRIAHIFSEDEMISIKQQVMQEVFHLMADADFHAFNVERYTITSALFNQTPHQ